MVKLVLGYIWEELGELIVVFGGLCIVLDVEIAVGEEGECSATTRLELELVVEDVYDLGVLESNKGLPRCTSGL